MHSVARAIVVVFACTALIATGQGPASAADCPTVRRETYINKRTGKVETRVVKIPCPGSSKPGRKGGKPGQPAPPDPCAMYPANPQPPKSDPVWGGHTDGVIMVIPCYLIPQLGNGYQWQPTAAAAPTVTPAQLAQQALASLTLPKPVVNLSPGNNSDAGLPYTWVNLWTWYWTSPASWRVLSKTAAVGAVSSTVQVAPRVLSFDPGDGSGAVTCAGPGRAWVAADGQSAPSGGACGVRYRSVAASVTATLSIRWAVTWTGSGGASGSLPDMTTSTSSTFQVEQIQSVNR